MGLYLLLAPPRSKSGGEGSLGVQLGCPRGRKSLRHARLPIQRTTPPVSYGEYRDDLAMDQEDNGIRKPPQQGAANTWSATYLGERRRLLRHAGHARTAPTNSAPRPSPRASYQCAASRSSLRAAPWKRSS